MSCVCMISFLGPVPATAGCRIAFLLRLSNTPFSPVVQQDGLDGSSVTFSGGPWDLWKSHGPYLRPWLSHSVLHGDCRPHAQCPPPALFVSCSFLHDPRSLFPPVESVFSLWKLWCCLAFPPYQCPPPVPPYPSVVSETGTSSPLLHVGF